MTAAGRRRRLWLALIGLGVAGVAVALVLLLRDSPATRFAEAVDTTAAAGSARVTVTVALAAVPVLGDVALTVARGELDLAAGQARLVRSVPGLDDTGVELVYADGATFLRLPLPAERSWIRVAAGDDRSSASAPGVRNPATLLGLLRTLEGPPEVAGEEVLQGRPTTRYRVVVDLDREARRLPEQLGEAVVRLRRLRGSGDLPLHVWVDDRDLVRRIRYESTPDVPGVTAVRLATDVQLERFGDPVAIDPPDDDRLITVPTRRLADLDLWAQLRTALEELVPRR